MHRDGNQNATYHCKELEKAKVSNDWDSDGVHSLNKRLGIFTKYSTFNYMGERS